MCKIMLDAGHGGNEPEEVYQVQVGVFRNKNYADTLLTSLLQNRFPAYMEYDNRGYYVIKVGNNMDFQEAIEMEQELKGTGYETIIVTS